MKKRVIALGFFDGIHLGHKALIDKANEISKQTNTTSTVFTFSNHPSEVIFGNKIPFLVDENRREKQIIEIGKCDEVLFWDFNKQTANITWDDFITNVLLTYNPIHIVTGEDFRFGKNGDGSSEKLSKLCQKLGIGYSAIPKVTLNGKRVSSSLIRNHLSLGEISDANTLLGHNFEITGEVIHGRKQGRVIGFRTANMKMPTSIQPLPFGVYASNVKVSGRIFKSITNIGVVPSFCDTSDVFVETHILDFNQEIYGKEISVYLLDFLRKEQKFSSFDDVKKQITLDVSSRLKM